MAIGFKFRLVARARFRGVELACNGEVRMFRWRGTVSRLWDKQQNPNPLQLADPVLLSSAPGLFPSPWPGVAPAFGAPPCSEGRVSLRASSLWR
jgi:hypothetical protein